MTSSPAPLEALVAALEDVHAALAQGNALDAATAMDAAVVAMREAERLQLSAAPVASEARRLLEACEASAKALGEQLLGSMEELGASSRAHSAYRR